MSSKISVLITDLDNTLFDWVEMWYRPFNMMLNELERASGISRPKLINEIREVHKKHGTSEYAFLIEEIPSLINKFPNCDLVKKFNDVIHSYRIERKKVSKLYPSVLETLEELRSKGVLIVGYTESNAFYTNYRMRNLGLDGLIDHLYSPPDHNLPNNKTPDQIRMYPPETYDLKFTKHRYTPQGELKPNPKILLAIISEIGALPNQCIYIGDSLIKDIVMAQNAGICDVYAKYGKRQNSNEYTLLQQVSHWTTEQIEYE
ncbi:MAG: HAD family hydrolase, partial [Leptospirales bacterium]